MNNQISAENLQPTLHDGVKVITTELLAQLYGTVAIRIQQNYTRNKTRFVEGKHYVKVAGKALADLRLSLRESQNQSANLQVSLNPISTKTRSLILWTERGAARHAKMLETDQAWEVFEKLEDYYFTKGEAVAQPEVAPEPASEQKQRYFIRMVVVDRFHGKTETFQGDADTVKDIVYGTAKLFGMHINKLIHLPATV